MPIIEARGLARTFTSRKRTVEAVRGVDLTVEDGEIVGFLGPNGAGKTTTLRMLTTLLRPTAGTATVAGADLLADPLGLRRRIGHGPRLAAGNRPRHAVPLHHRRHARRLQRAQPDHDHAGGRGGLHRPGRLVPVARRARLRPRKRLTTVLAGEIGRAH